MNVDPQVLASAEALVSTVAAAIAAVAAVVALVLARRTLREAGSTTAVQRETVHATEAVAERIEASTRALHRILAETQAVRELEQLRRIANQVGVVTVLRHAVMRADDPSREPRPWNDFTDAKDLLAAYLEAMSADALPACRVLADPADARLADRQLETDAKVELKKAFAAAGARLHDPPDGPT
jgi:hypothetical protein